MKKREDFAVSLRKKKTHDLINAKRRKIMHGGNAYNDNGGMVQMDGRDRDLYSSN